jgi:hypothetical protein
MPPTILRDAVQQVVEKLSQHISTAGLIIPEPLVARAREQVRILETRVATGKLGQHDRAERRAAICLEYVVRQSQKKTSSSTVRLSLTDLARAVGMKLTHLQNLHEVVGNYLQQPQPQQRQQQKQPPKRQQSSLLKATATDILDKRRKLRNSCDSAGGTDGTGSSSSSTISARRIHDLAICLAAHVVDPHGFAQQAVQLLSDVEHYMKALTAVHERRGHLYDLQRYRAAYEAACFYQVATRGQGHIQQQRAGGGARRKSGANAHDNNDNDNDDGPQRPLQLADLVDASNDFTFLEVKQVWPHVKELAERIEQEKKIQQQKEKQGTAKNTAPTTSTTLRKQATVTTTTNTRKKASDRMSAAATAATTTAKKQVTATATEWDLSNDNNDDTDMHLEVSHDDDIVTFQEWKEQMLSQAIHQAKQDIRNTTTAAAASSSTVDDNNNKSKDTDTDTMDHVNASSSRDDDSISYETALERAADTVLHKYGLLLQV